ncbi:BspA family leucine-rich repeat surface protein [Lactobacillus sp. ESL0785]|uniref:BspA family leucine-rich repeat surface protein n=1 Tax=Lactobacillus sp. ESL0785 TaxID=2983232 RepID=UPI0023F6AB48|nr:BspA family leucine-rich repeat surface protein [Lactobacillus sp. ESL0785]WEV71200.1 BspA family leucine-rich repeat surface protein [Lactobacillus sp. ESL0785]
MLKLNITGHRITSHHSIKNNSTKIISYSLTVSVLISSCLVFGKQVVAAEQNSPNFSIQEQIHNPVNNVTVINNLEIPYGGLIRGKDNSCTWIFDNRSGTLTIESGFLSDTPLSELLTAANYKGLSITPQDVHHIVFKITTTDNKQNGDIVLASNCNRKFANLPNLIDIDGLYNVDASNVDDMSSMFAQDPQLTYLDLNAWNTSSLTDMNSMFKQDNNLTNLNLNDLNTSSVFDMSHLFEGDTALTNLKLAGWKTGNVTDMNNMFNGIAVTNLNDINNWSTYNVTDMSYLFNDPELRQLNLSRWDTANVVDMTNMFANLGATSAGFALTLGKHHLASNALASLQMKAIIPVASGTPAAPAGKTISLSELKNRYSATDNDCPTETYVSQPIKWSYNPLDFAKNDDESPFNHLPNTSPSKTPTNGDSTSSNYQPPINNGAASPDQTPDKSFNPPQAPGSDSSKTTQVTATPPVNIPATNDPNAKAKKVTKIPQKLYYPIQLYNQIGEPIKNSILKAGLTIETYGTQIINNQKFYILGQNIYANSTDIDGQTKRVTHNAYTYNRNGKRLKNKAVLKKNHHVQVFGKAITIKNKLYFIVDTNQYVKAQNLE